MATTMLCECCGDEFETERDEADAEAEAERLWGVKNAASDPNMAVVCDGCFRKLVIIREARS